MVCNHIESGQVRDWERTETRQHNTTTAILTPMENVILYTMQAKSLETTLTKCATEHLYERVVLFHLTFSKKLSILLNFRTPIFSFKKVLEATILREFYLICLQKWFLFRDFWPVVCSLSNISPNISMAHQCLVSKRKRIHLHPTRVNKLKPFPIK